MQEIVLAEEMKNLLGDINDKRLIVFSASLGLTGIETGSLRSTREMFRNVSGCVGAVGKNASARFLKEQERVPRDLLDQPDWQCNGRISKRPLGTSRLLYRSVQIPNNASNKCRWSKQARETTANFLLPDGADVRQARRLKDIVYNPVMRWHTG